MFSGDLPLYADPEIVMKPVGGKFKIGKIDLSQIECRILNTLAGQWDVVEKFRNGTDIYSELATQFYGFPVSKDNPAERGTGKQLELSCGYGAGGPTIVRTARAGTYGPPVHLTDAQGLAARDLYRGAHPHVVNLWETAGRMLWEIYHGNTVEWGPCTIHDHRIFGPGDLWLDWTSLERHIVEDGEQRKYGTDAGKEVWRRRVREGWQKMYPAKCVENLIQWLASYPIRHGMVRISQLGYRIPLTVHDDVFILIPCEQCEERFAQCVAEMEKPLDWLPECPIAVDPKLLDALDE